MKRLVFVGAGHAHLTALMNIARLPDDTHITVVNPSSHHYYSGMGPGMLSGMYRPRALRFHVQRLVEERGAAFVVARVVQLHPAQNELVLENGDTLPYDIVSFATGSVVVVADMPHHAALFMVKPIEELLKARRAIFAHEEQTLRGAVFGGGAAGVEIAGNLWRLGRECGKNLAITMVSARKILGRFPATARLLARQSLERRGIAILEDTRVCSIEKNSASLDTGETIDFEIAFHAMGIRPSPIFQNSDIPTGGDGGLLVNEYLHSISYPNVFGGGDCISFAPRPLEKAGVYAVRQRLVLWHNIRARLRGTPLKRFIPPQSHVAILNMGDGTGIYINRSRAWHARLAFLIKHIIDTSYMNNYQVSGERAEHD